MDQQEPKNTDSHEPEPSGKQIILFAFLISIVIHAGAFVAFRGILPLPWFGGKHRAYRVYLIRPPMNEIMEASNQDQPAITEIPDEPLIQDKEATISLDTKDPTYHPYTKMLKDKIYNHWTYPLTAREDLIQGSLLIVFRLDSDGNLIASNIERPSGHEILDTYALEAIRAAHPFPPFPEDITVQFLNINATFAYELRFE